MWQKLVGGRLSQLEVTRHNKQSICEFFSCERSIYTIYILNKNIIKSPQKMNGQFLHKEPNVHKSTGTNPLRLSIKKILFPVQRVAKIEASRAAANFIFFPLFFFSMKILSIFFLLQK